jgi:hypothetical protein
LFCYGLDCSLDFGGLYVPGVIDAFRSIVLDIHFSVGITNSFLEGITVSCSNNSGLIEESIYDRSLRMIDNDNREFSRLQQRRLLSLHATESSLYKT